MKRNLFICAIAIMLLAIGSCKQDHVGPVNSDGTPPGPVSNVTVVNLNGAARISYALPTDADLLYIKAIYTSKQGAVRETKVSRTNSNLTVVGFGDTDAYKVTLYAVDNGENVSSPVDVVVHPLKPAVKLVRDSITVSPDFGGVNVKFVNPTEESLAIVVLSNNNLNQFAPINTNYTNLKRGDFTVRGLAAVPTKFGVFVRDRFGNLSDTIIVTLTPLFEQLLDRTKMKGLVLPTDAPLGYNGTIAGLFDGNIHDGFYHSGDAAVMPQQFTYDMGVTAKLSRMSYFMRDQFFFALHSPKVVEIWGSNNPNPNGSYDSSWILLTKYTDIKPSGLPVGQLSQADFDQGSAGESIIFPLSIPKVRYIRFRTLENWTGGTYVNFYEIMMWGDTK
jgi:hypothetical protein